MVEIRSPHQVEEAHDDVDDPVDAWFEKEGQDHYQCWEQDVDQGEGQEYLVDRQSRGHFAARRTRTSGIFTGSAMSDHCGVWTRRWGMVALARPEDRVA